MVHTSGFALGKCATYIGQRVSAGFVAPWVKDEPARAARAIILLRRRKDSCCNAEVAQ